MLVKGATGDHTLWNNRSPSRSRHLYDKWHLSNANIMLRLLDYDTVDAKRPVCPLRDYYINPITYNAINIEYVMREGFVVETLGNDMMETKHRQICNTISSNALKMHARNPICFSRRRLPLAGECLIGLLWNPTNWKNWLCYTNSSALRIINDVWPTRKYLFILFCVQLISWRRRLSFEENRVCLSLCDDSTQNINNMLN